MMKTKQAVQHRPAGYWQMDVSKITSKHVQYWHNGVMETAQMTQASARKLVLDGKAFVVSEQAIGALVDGYMQS